MQPHLRVIVAAAILVLASSPQGVAAPRPVCGGTSSVYAAALCYYHQGDLAEAAATFTALIEEDRPHPETLKSRYFLARTWMRQQRWEEASAELIKIYSISPAFYGEWGCDFLLGETRRALGLD